MDNPNKPRVHESIVEQFHLMIRNGTLRHGQRLPSERDLSNQYKVSRSSIREAIRSLELQGLVVRKRGSGTLVNTDGSDSILSLMATNIGMGSEGLEDIFEMHKVDLTEASKINADVPKYYINYESNMAFCVIAAASVSGFIAIPAFAPAFLISKIVLCI